MCWYCSLGVSSTCPWYRELPKTCQGRWSWRLAFKFQVPEILAKNTCCGKCDQHFFRWLNAISILLRFRGILGFLKQQLPRNCCRFWKCCCLKSAVRSGAWLRSCEGVRGACRSALSIRWRCLGWLKPWPPKWINIDEQKPDAPNFVVLFKYILAFVAITIYICGSWEKSKDVLDKTSSQGICVGPRDHPTFTVCQQLLLWGVVRQLRPRLVRVSYVSVGGT